MRALGQGFYLPLAVLLSACAAPAAADLTWRDTPTVQRHEPGHAGGHGHSRTPVVFLREGEGARIHTVFPTLEQREEILNGERLTVHSSGMDNYHLLWAERSANGVQETALRYVYLHGKPSGRSPSELTAASQAALEIVPDPLPREHWRYESGEPALFRLRFQGKPLADAIVTLATANGSLLAGRSDERGQVRFTLPEDFAQVTPGRSANRPADFVLRTLHESDGRRYVTTLSAPYHVNPAHWQSGVGGLAALGAGFLLGFAALRRIPA